MSDSVSCAGDYSLSHSAAVDMADIHRMIDETGWIDWMRSYYDGCEQGLEAEVGVEGCFQCFLHCHSDGLGYCYCRRLRSVRAEAREIFGAVAQLVVAVAGAGQFGLHGPEVGDVEEDEVEVVAVWPVMDAGFVHGVVRKEGLPLEQAGYCYDTRSHCCHCCCCCYTAPLPVSEAGKAAVAGMD